MLCSRSIISSSIYIKLHVSLFVPYAFLYRSTDSHEIWYIGVFEYGECFGGIYFIDTALIQAEKRKPAKKKENVDKNSTIKVDYIIFKKNMCSYALKTCF